MSATEPTPPEAMTGMAVAASTVAQPVEVGAGQRAVPVDGGDDHRGQAGAGQPRRAPRPPMRPGPLLPAPDRHLGPAVGHGAGSRCPGPPGPG